MIEEDSEDKKSIPEDASREQDVKKREAGDKETDQSANPPPGQPPRADPTRYGDWEKNGRCIDF